MPPRSVPRRVEDLILYYYAKLVIAPSAGLRENYGFIIDAYQRLKSGQIRMSDYDRELTHLRQQTGSCMFCGMTGVALQPVHVVPRHLGGPIGVHNQVLACVACAASKGDKDLVTWWCGEMGKARDELPRVAVGLYLKIAFEVHKVNFTLRRQCDGLHELFPSATAKDR